MATSWLDDFERRLGNIKSRRTQLNKPVSGLNSVALTQLAPDFDSSKFLSNNPNGVGEHLLDWGGRALDVISRPGYAVGGFLNDILSDAVEGPDDENPFGAAWEGFTGRRKEFFHPAQTLVPHEEGESFGNTAARWVIDFLAAVGTDPVSYLPAGMLIKGAKTAGDFTGLSNVAGKAAEGLRPKVKISESVDDIAEAQDELAGAMSPESRPPGYRDLDVEAQRRAQAQAGYAGTNVSPPLAIEGSRFDRPNTETLFDLNPEQAAVRNRTPVGDFLDNFVPSQSPGQSALPFSVLDKEAQDILTQKALDFGGDLVQKGESNANKLALFQLVRSSISDSLANIRGRLNFNDVKSPWTTQRIEHDVLPEPRKKEFPEIPKPSEGVPFNESVFKHTIKRTIIDSPDTIKTANKVEALKQSKLHPDADVVDQRTMRLYWRGEEFDFDSWVKDPKMNLLGDLTTPEGFIEWAKRNPDLRITAGVAPGATMTPIQYANMFSRKSKNKPAPKGTLRKKGKSMPIAPYVAERKEKWLSKSVGASKPEKAKYQKAVKAQDAEKAKYAEQVKAYEDSLLQLDDIVKIKPTRQQLETWLRANKIVLSPEEKKRLLNTANLGNETGFMNLIQKFSETERKLNIDTIADLDKAVKAGRVDAKVLQDIYDKLGVSTPGLARKKIEAIDRAIERARDAQIKQSVKETDQAIKLEEKAFKAAHDPKVVGEVPHKIDDPLVPINEAAAKAGTKSEGDYLREQAEAIVDKATTPDIAAMIKPEHKARLVDIAQSYLAREWADFKKRHPYKSPRGAGKTDPRLMEGTANWFGEFNMRKQTNFWSETIKSLSKEVGGQLKGNARAKAIRDQALPILKAMDEIMRSYGIHPTTHPGGSGFPLSLYDIITSMPEAAQLKFVFNAGRQIQPSQLFQIADLAMAVKLADDMPDIWGGGDLLKITSDLSQFSKEVQGLLKGIKIETGGKSAAQYAKGQGAKASERELAKTSKAHGFDADNPPSNFAKDASIRGKAVADNNMKTPFAALISEDFVRTIQAKVAYNSDRAGIQYGEFVSKHTEANVQRLLDDFHNAKSNQEVLDIFNKALPTTEKATLDNTAIIPPVGGMRSVMDNIEESISNASTSLAAKQQRAFNEAKDARQHKQSRLDTMENTEKLAQKLVKTVNLAENPQISLWARMVRAFAPHMAEGDLRKLLLEQEIFAGYFTAEFSAQLSNLQKTFGSPKIKQLFDDVRLGVGATDPKHFDEIAEFNKILNRIFDDGRPVGSNWSLKGNGISPAHFNSQFSHFGIPDKFKFALDDVDFTGWRNWDDVDDPLDLLSRMHAAQLKSIAEASFGEAISLRWGSKVYKEGYVKIASAKGSKMRHLIDTNRYYPKEIAENMAAMEMTLREMSKPGTQSRLARIFDNATHRYKTGLTIYRPGHHMRNMFGDIWLSFMDGVQNPLYYSKALTVMRTRKDHFKDFNFDASLSDLQNNIDTIINIHGMKLNPDDVYRLGARHGLYPDYRTLEDLNVSAAQTARAQANAFAGANFRPFGGKVHDAAAGFSEMRDHYVRTAHFIHAFEQAAKKSKPRGNSRQAQQEFLDEMASIASARVRKWHPNGADLTSFEKNVMRRSVLFYSWIRKAIPLVIESFFVNPGRFLAFPKAMYVAAESNGIDLNGFTDPFPTDQLFPTWLGGMQGPFVGQAGSYMGLRPGIPMMDILDQYFTSPGKTFETILSSAHPVAKIPFELATGSTTQGIPVNDVGKYLLGQVPFGSFANTMAGKPIGGVSPSDEGYDPGGIRDSRAIALTNMLTGLGLIDMSKPSYIKSGEFDVKYGRQGTY